MFKKLSDIGWAAWPGVITAFLIVRHGWEVIPWLIVGALASIGVFWAVLKWVERGYTPTRTLNVEDLFQDRDYALAWDQKFTEEGKVITIELNGKKMQLGETPEARAERDARLERRITRVHELHDQGVRLDEATQKAKQEEAS